MAEPIPLIILRSRDPASLGDVEGAFHPSVSASESSTINARSSRRGKEHTRSKTSIKAAVRWSDLRVDDDPWNGRMECHEDRPVSKHKRTTL